MKSFEDCVAAALGTLNAEVRSRFPTNPLLTMRTDLGLKVQEAPHLTERRADGGACDGLSFLKDGVILFAPTPQSRRENFTLAHELGHWLVAQVPEIFDWLSAQSKPKLALETLCDRIAQRLLIRDEAISTVVREGPIRAQHVLDLYASSQASMPACAIAISARLPGLGAIIVVDRDPGDDDPVVRYASIRPDPELGWPKVYPWPGQKLPAAHPLRFITEAAPILRRTYWATSWSETADYYMDAVAVSDARAIAVLADRDLWGAERFHPQTRRDYDARPTQEITCCGQIRIVRGYPCQVCGEPFCPNCGKCRCDRQNDELVQCAGHCFLSYKPHLLVNGLCEECR